MYNQTQTFHSWSNLNKNPGKTTPKTQHDRKQIKTKRTMNNT